MEKVRAILMYEMLGRPKEHIEETMKKLIEVISSEKGITIIEKKFNKAKEFEQKDKEGKIIKVIEEKKLYTTFSEVELETRDFVSMLSLCFKYIPSHIEIIEPFDINMSNLEINNILNDITSRLHNYDSIAKTAIMQNQVLANKIKEMQAGFSSTSDNLNSSDSKTPIKTTISANPIAKKEKNRKVKKTKKKR